MDRSKTISNKVEITELSKSRSMFSKELEERITIGDELINREVTSLQQLEQLKKDYYNWGDFNEELLRRSFNNLDNEYFRDYSNCTEWIGVKDELCHIDTNSTEYKISHEKLNIEASLTNLNRLLEKLSLIEEQVNIPTSQDHENNVTNKCFMVHGHNGTIKFEIARFIENELKKSTIILHEQPNKGRTIIEKFENYSSVDFAVGLWTADDVGRAKSDRNLNDRARQNVIFETGFFIGKLGRQNVIVLYEDGVEIPSDYSGIVFIKIEGNWKDDLRKEVKAIYNLTD